MIYPTNEILEMIYQRKDIGDEDQTYFYEDWTHRIRNFKENIENYPVGRCVV